MGNKTLNHETGALSDLTGPLHRHRIFNRTPHAAAERQAAETRMRAGETAYSVARDMGIPYTTVRQWRVAMVERDRWDGVGAPPRHMPDTSAFSRDVNERIAERAARLAAEDIAYLRRHRQSRTVPFPGDPPPGRSALDRLLARRRVSGGRS